MPTFRHGVAATLAVAMLTCAQSAPARQTSSPDAVGRWVAEAQESLRQRLVDPFPLGKPSDPAGVADIAFRMRPNGRAEAASVLHSSGVRSLDAKALTAVARIRTRTPPPGEPVGGRRYVARVFFAASDRTPDATERQELVTRTAARNGWSEDVALASDDHGVLLTASR